MSRSYSDPTYPSPRTITFGGPHATNGTLGTQGCYAAYQFMFPCTVQDAKLRYHGNQIGLNTFGGIEDMSLFTEMTLCKSTDTGTNLEVAMGTFDYGSVTGTHPQDDPGQNYTDFDMVTETSFDTGDFIIFTCEGEWDESVHFTIELSVVENFSATDN